MESNLYFIQNCAQRCASNGGKDRVFTGIVNGMVEPMQRQHAARSTLLIIAVAGKPLHTVKPPDQAHCDKCFLCANLYEHYRLKH